MIRCPWCSALQYIAAAFLGRLAARRHYRCVYCHGMWSKGGKS